MTASQQCTARPSRLACWLHQRVQPAQVLQLLHGLDHEQLQHQLLQTLELDPVLQRHPLEHNYKYSLLKGVMRLIEREGGEVTDELAAAFADCALQAPTSGEDEEEAGGPQAAGGTWVTRTWTYAPAVAPAANGNCNTSDCSCHPLSCPSSPPAGPLKDECTTTATSLAAPDDEAAGVMPGGSVTLRVSTNLLAGGTGCACWEAAFRLAELLLRAPHLVAGKTVLELGCGSGLLGVVAARLGPAHLVLTDGDESSVANCLHNLKLNRVIREGGSRAGCQAQPSLGIRHITVGPQAPQVQCAVLRWGEGMEDEVPAALRPDLLLASDVVYSPVIIPELVHALSHFLVPAGSRAGKSSTAGGKALKTSPPPVEPRHKLQHEGKHQDDLHASGGQTSRHLRQVGGPDPQPVALIASTVRQEATLSMFLQACRDAGLTVSEVTGSSYVSHATCTPPVQFLHVPGLQEAHVLIHEITWMPAIG